MGTPDFAVSSLDILNKFHNIKAVVTVPDKKAGRGQKIKQSAVKLYALKNNIKTLQPQAMSDEMFIDNLKSINADVFVVVAFRILPEKVFNIPPLGTFNLHASLLPDYRGAAPINHAIINGEKQTGVTTFFIDKNIDTGEILFQNTIDIQKNETAGTLHDKLMMAGAKLVLKTLNAIENNNYTPKIQKNNTIIKKAPKIFPKDCFINWENSGTDIINFIRGLSPYPAARTVIAIDEKKQLLKIYDAEFIPDNHKLNTASLITDNESIKISVADGFISLIKIQPESKKPMQVSDFLRGYKNRLPDNL